MKLSQIKCGDEVYYAGEPHVAIKDGRQAGTQGEAAKLATVMLARVADAGVSEDGTLEFGTAGYSSRHVSDEDVPVLRSNVRFHSSAHYSSLVDGHTVPVDTKYNREDAMRAELKRRTLQRERQVTEGATVDSVFRLAVAKSLKAGLGVAEIAEQTGLSRARIYQIRDGRR